MGTVVRDAHSTEIRGSHTIKCAKKESIICDFILPNAALKTPNLGFVFEVPVFVDRGNQRISMPSSELLYFKLKDVPRSDLSICDKLRLSITTIAKQFGYSPTK
ncbi:MAG: hypothetical protein C4288_17700 [Leptolyngbya sp. ERB_1_1]